MNTYNPWLLEKIPTPDLRYRVLSAMLTHPYSSLREISLFSGIYGVLGVAYDAGVVPSCLAIIKILNEDKVKNRLTSHINTVDLVRGTGPVRGYSLKGDEVFEEDYKKLLSVLPSIYEPERKNKTLEEFIDRWF